MRASKQHKNVNSTLHAVIYARFSSHSQTEQSIEGQLRDCYNYAQANNIKIIGEYIDRALSAKTDNRPNFQKMIKDSEKGLFNMIIVWKLDRFARNRYDSATYKARLRRNGVKVVSAMENISDNAEGILVESLLEGMAEYYSVELAQKVTRGLRESAYKHKATGGLPYGYKADKDKNIILDEERVPVVQKIYEMYLGGHTAKEITDYLNGKGFRTQKGGAWNKNSLPRILSNPRYTGTYIYKDYVCPDAIPRIINDDTFEKVQAIMNKNRRKGAVNKAKVEYLLTTKLFCGHCKAMMIGETGTSKTGNIYHYYKCSTRKKDRHACNKKTVQKQYIEDLIVNSIYNNIIQRDDVIERIADRAMEIQAAEQDNGILEVLQARLSEIDKSLNNMLSAIESGVVTKTTKRRLEELESEREDVEFEIQKEQVAKPKIERDVIVFLIDQFRDGDINDVEYRKRLIDTFIHKVYVYDDKLLIIYNYTNRETQVNEQELIDYAEGLSSDIEASAPPKSRQTALLCGLSAFYILSEKHKFFMINFICLKSCHDRNNLPCLYRNGNGIAVYFGIIFFGVLLVEVYIFRPLYRFSELYNGI